MELSAFVHKKFNMTHKNAKSLISSIWECNMKDRKENGHMKWKDLSINFNLTNKISHRTE